MKHPSCPKCSKVYKQKDMVATLGGFSNICGIGLIAFKCACGYTMKMHYIEPTKKTAFFLVLKDK
jgi:predicted nucleic-acid-binding Zn-ribbon protein